MMTDDALQAGAEPLTLARVVVFVLRERGDDRELLIVRHATAHSQLPNITVGLDEPEDAAALRVARDWTSFEVVALRRRLAIFQQTLPADEWIVVRPLLLRTAPNPDATMMRFVLERGMPVRVTDARGDYVRVVYEEAAMEDEELSISTRRAGWASAGSLANQVDYHLYELRAPTPSSNLIMPKMHPPSAGVADWVSLSRVPSLERQHEEWLIQVMPFLNGTEG